MKKFLLPLLLFSSFSSIAQSELDTVTVTASLQTTRVLESGRNITIIKGEEFNNLPVHSVDDLLRYLPGVEVQQRGPMGAQSDVTLRGGTFQQVLVIIDGARLNDPNSGHFTGYIPVDPSEIDHIEILKGASSAIYGTEAVGGVIHIITKAFATRTERPKSNAIIQLTAGEYDLFNVHAGGLWKEKNTIINGGFLSNNTSGQQQRGMKGYLYSDLVSLSISQKLGTYWQLSLRSSFDKRDFGAQNFYTTFVSDTSKEKVTTWWNQAQVNYIKNKHSLQLHAGYKQLDDRFAYNSVSIVNENRSRLWQALLTDEWRFNEATTITTGIQVIDKYINSNDRGKHQLTDGAAFIVWNQEIGEKFRVIPSIRGSYNDRNGFELVPQIQASYHLKDLQFRASAGKTTRDADFTERFNNYNKPFVSGGRIGNPDLQTEHSFSYEAGADYMPGSLLKFSATYFKRHHSRLIDYVNTPYSEMPRKENLSPTGKYALAKNISEVTSEGFETDVQYVWKINTHNKLTGTLGITVIDSDIENNVQSLYISSHANFLGNFNLQWFGNYFSLHLNGIYKSRSPQNSAFGTGTVVMEREYFLMNAKAAVHLWGNKLSIFAQADNITDKKYQDILGAHMPGRWMMAGLSFKLNQ